MADMSDRLTVRGVDPRVWRQARLAALHRGLTMGEAVNEALRAWLAGAHAPFDAGERHATEAARRTDRPQEAQP